MSTLVASLELLIENYFWLFLIAAPIVWYLIRPMADMILKIIAILCILLAIGGGVLFLLAHV